MRYTTLVLTTLLAAGCCMEEEASVRAEGEIVYAGSQKGTIVVTLCESESNRCCGVSICGQGTGKCVAKTELDRPGEFSLDGTVKWVDSQPSTVLMVNLEDDGGVCLAGASMDIPAGGDLEAAMLVLVDGGCLGRM